MVPAAAARWSTVWCGAEDFEGVGDLARPVTSTVIRSIETRPTSGQGVCAGEEHRGAGAEGAVQAVGVAGGDGGDAGGAGGGPGGAVADRLAGRQVADLDHRQRQRHHRPRRGERQPAVEADAGAGQAVVEGRAEQDAAGGGEAAADPGKPRGEAVEGGRPGGGSSGAPGSSAQARWLSASTGARRGRSVGGGGEVRRSRPRRFIPESSCSVHGRPGRSRAKCSHLSEAVQAWDQVGGAAGVGVAGHQPGEDVDRRAGAERGAEGDALLGEGDEEGARAGGGQRRGDAGGAEAVGVGLHHRGGLDLRRGEGVEGPPVGGDGVEVDGQAGAGDGGIPSRRGPRYRAASARPVKSPSSEIAGAPRGTSPADGRDRAGAAGLTAISDVQRVYIACTSRVRVSRAGAKG